METCKPEFTVDVAQVKRSTSLVSLPLELRLEIYRHSFLAEQNVQGQSSVYLMCHGLRAAEIKKHCSPSILRVSRAIYEEALTIHYEESTFEYHCQANEDGSLTSFKNLYSKTRCEKIKHIELHCHQRLTKLTAECVSRMLEFLKSLGYCSLNTLRLHFVLEPTYQPSEVLQAFLSRSVVDSAFERDRLLESIQALQVQQRIEVHLDTEMEEDGQGYEYLVNAIAAKMGWTIGLQNHESYPIVQHSVLMVHLSGEDYSWIGSCNQTKAPSSAYVLQLMEAAAGGRCEKGSWLSSAKLMIIMREWCYCG